MRELGFKIKYDRWELLLQRILFSFVVLTFAARQNIFSSQPQPNGFGRYINFTFLADPYISVILKVLLVIFTIFYVYGKFMPISVGYMFFYLLAVGTLKLSQGTIGHNTQLVVLVLLGQFCAYCYSSYLRFRKQPIKANSRLTAHDLAVYWTQQAIAAAYVLAGISKLKNAGIVWKMGLPIPGWIVNLPNIAVQIIKTHNQYYHNYLSIKVLEKGNLIANWIISYPNLTRILFSGGLFVELCAFLILINRRWSFWMGMAMILFHIGIFAFMQIWFSYNVYVLLIYTVNIPFLILSINKLWLKSRMRFG